MNKKMRMFKTLASRAPQAECQPRLRSDRLSGQIGSVLKGLICSHIGATIYAQELIYGDCHEYR